LIYNLPAHGRQKDVFLIRYNYKLSKEAFTNNIRIMLADLFSEFRIFGRAIFKARQSRCGKNIATGEI